MGHVVKRPYKEGVGEKPTTKKPLGTPTLRYNPSSGQRRIVSVPRKSDQFEDEQATEPHQAGDKSD